MRFQSLSNCIAEVKYALLSCEERLAAMEKYSYSFEVSKRYVIS
jgi:hypothetical protein